MPSNPFKHFTRRGLLLYFASLLALTTTTVSVVAYATAPLPPARENQGVVYVTGGIGLDESNALKAAMPSYPLAVEVYQQSGGKNEYSASATLKLNKAQGKQVFEATLEGPFALLKVAPGNYEVEVALEGQVQRKPVKVKTEGHARASFVFKS